MRLVHLHRALSCAKSGARIAQTTTALRAYEDELLAKLAVKGLPPIKIAWDPRGAPRSWGGR